MSEFNVTGQLPGSRSTIGIVSSEPTIAIGTTGTPPASPCRRTRLVRTVRGGIDPVGLVGALGPFGEHEQQLAVVADEPHRIVRMGDDPAGPSEQGSEHRHRRESVVVQPVHRPVQFSLDAVHHQAAQRGRPRHDSRPAPRRPASGSAPGVRSGTGTSTGTPAPQRSYHRPGSLRRPHRSMPSPSGTGSGVSAATASNDVSREAAGGTCGSGTSRPADVRDPHPMDRSRSLGPNVDPSPAESHHHRAPRTSGDDHVPGSMVLVADLVELERRSQCLGSGGRQRRVGGAHDDAPVLQRKVDWAHRRRRPARNSDSSHAAALEQAHGVLAGEDSEAPRRSVVGGLHDGIPPTWGRRRAVQSDNHKGLAQTRRLLS